MALNNYENVTEIIGKQYHFFAHILSVDKSHIPIQVGSYLITIYISHYSAFSINSANSLYSCHIKSTIYFLHINEIIENEVNTGLALRYVTWALPWGLWVSFLLLYGLREPSTAEHPVSDQLHRLTLTGMRCSARQHICCSSIVCCVADTLAKYWWYKWSNSTRVKYFRLGVLYLKLCVLTNAWNQIFKES